MKASSEEILMMRAPGRMRFSASRDTRIVPRTLTPKMRSKSDATNCASGRSPSVPAQFTSTSKLPSRAAAPPTASMTCASWSRSATKIGIAPAGPGSRSIPTTEAPALANARAIAPPMPPAAPVTRTPLPPKSLTAEFRTRRFGHACDDFLGDQRALLRARAARRGEHARGGHPVGARRVDVKGRKLRRRLIGDQIDPDQIGVKMQHQGGLDHGRVLERETWKALRKDGGQRALGTEVPILQSHHRQPCAGAIAQPQIGPLDEEPLVLIVAVHEHQALDPVSHEFANGVAHLADERGGIEAGGAT